MLYKTIVLELLQQRPEMYDPLLRNQTLMATLELYSRQLRTSHLAWKDHLTPLRPGSDASQVASEAMELAMQDLIDTLPPASTPSDATLSLDEAMAFLRSHPA